MELAPRKKFIVAEYLEWALAQSEGRYELVDGEIIAMVPETLGHVEAKGNIYSAFRNAISEKQLPCQAFTDGAAVKIDDFHLREPDVSVRCGPRQSDGDILLDAPLIVVEVVSPSSVTRDITEKYAEYFSVPSIQHYLIVQASQRVVIHHQRVQQNQIRSVHYQEGTITFDPPGFTVAFDDLLPPPPEEPAAHETDAGADTN